MRRSDGARHADGSAGDADYGAIGAGYRGWRRPEPAFRRAIAAALGDARTVVNVGAGAGSYEPEDRHVVAVEPSASMRAQRPRHLAPAIDAAAEALPLDDDAVDAAMATFSVHQWGDLERGLAELRRVAAGPVVLLTCDPARIARTWIAEYAPELVAVEARRFPPIDRLVAGLGGSVEVVRLPIPRDCADGFMEAYFGRPELLLEEGARRANSAWSFAPAGVEERFVERLAADLADGSWDAAHGHLRSLDAWDGSLTLLVARP